MKENLKRIINVKNIAIGILCIVVLILLIIPKDGKGDEFIMQMPLKDSFIDSSVTTFSCKALITSSITEDNTYSEIEGVLSEGTDIVSMEIVNTDILRFITGAALKAGETNASEFLILSNSGDYLVAALNSISGGVDVITINKQNGSAIWSKSNNLFGLGLFGAVTYLDCTQ